MINSTKHGFSFRTIIPIINILHPHPHPKSTVAEGYLSFWKQKRKQARSRKGITPKIKFSFEKIVTIQSPTLPSLVRSVIYTALLCRKLLLGSSRKEPREGEKETQAQKGEERKRKWRRD